jgi:DNA end-binding protein Ku
MVKPFNPAAVEDTYGAALEELVERKQKGHAIIVENHERRSSGKVVNLIEALKKSTGEQPASSGRGPKTPAVGRGEEGG